MSEFYTKTISNYITEMVTFETIQFQKVHFQKIETEERPPVEELEQFNFNDPNIYKKE